LALNLTAAPFVFRGCDHGGEVAAESPCKSNEWCDSGLRRMLNPLPDTFAIALLERVAKLDS
jgi:hypothetical protein